MATDLDRLEEIRNGRRCEHCFRCDGLVDKRLELPR